MRTEAVSTLEAAVMAEKKDEKAGLLLVGAVRLVECAMEGDEPAIRFADFKSAATAFRALTEYIGGRTEKVAEILNTCGDVGEALKLSFDGAPSPDEFGKFARELERQALGASTTIAPGRVLPDPFVTKPILGRKETLLIEEIMQSMHK
jgi:hypothetical protein